MKKAKQNKILRIEKQIGKYRCADWVNQKWKTKIQPLPTVCETDPNQVNKGKIP